METILNFDFAVLDWIQATFKCAFMDFIMPLVTYIGEYGLFWIAMALVMIIIPRTRKTGVMMGMALALGLLVCNVTLKPLIERVRPYDVREGVELLIAAQHDFSFPSGHTLACFECATVLMIRDRRFGIPSLVIAFLVAFSRLYLFVHYPTDVIVSMILGVLFGVVSYYFINYLWRAIESRRAQKK